MTKEQAYYAGYNDKKAQVYRQGYGGTPRTAKQCWEESKRGR